MDRFVCDDFTVNLALAALGFIGNDSWPAWFICRHRSFSSLPEVMKGLLPNKPDAVNPAMALRLTIDDRWCRVTDLGRSAEGEIYDL